MGQIGLWPMPCLGLSILAENGIYIRSRVLDRERSQMMRDEVVRLSKALTAAPRLEKDNWLKCDPISRVSGPGLVFDKAIRHYYLPSP